MTHTPTTLRGLGAEFLKAEFDRAHTYADHVASGNESQRDAWARIREQATITKNQQGVLSAFTRRMKVLVTSGVWCGDCSQQLPLLDVIATSAPEGLVDVRYADRDAHGELASMLSINAGLRVPVAVFMAEDFEPCSVFGDRTLTRYRAMADRQLGAACMVPGAPLPDDEIAGTLQDWLDEVERVHIMLRLSGRLRQKHGD